MKQGNVLCYFPQALTDLRDFFYEESNLHYLSTNLHLRYTKMVRISRTCIMNTDHLKEIRQLKNSHLEAVMDNDEKLIVSRKYLKDIKSVFKRSQL